MDFYEIQKHRTTVNRQPSRHKGKRLTEDQVRLLEKSFSSDKKLDPERKLQLAVELGVPPRQVAIWYQNKRARWKTQTLELEYNTLQVKLDSTMAEKRELERDVERLRAELRKAREKMALARLTHQAQEPSNNNNNCNNNSNSNSNCNNNSNSNVIISCRSNNVVSGSSEEGGWSTSASNNSFNDDDRRQLQVSCCWEEGEENIKALHLDDLFACVMFANGPAGSDD